jgi:hypothetical protein
MVTGKTVGGLKVAHIRSYQLNGMEVQRFTTKEITLNAAIPPATFAVPDAIKAAAKPPATSNIPFQWVVRRIFLARFTDSDAIYFPPSGSFKLVELGPNVQMVQGGGANNLIVNMNDGLVVVDAPVDEGQSKWVIDAAKEVSGKPIKTLVLTHHHMDHTGGMRVFAAEGPTVTFQRLTRPISSKPSGPTLEPDAQQKAMKPANVQEVKDTRSLKDDTVKSTSTTSRTRTWRACCSCTWSRTTSCGLPTSCRRAVRSVAIPARSRWVTR